MFVKQKLHLGRPGVQGKCREGRGFGGWVVGPGQESTGTIFVPKHFSTVFRLPVVNLGSYGALPQLMNQLTDRRH